jgi:hypothetical protein
MMNYRRVGISLVIGALLGVLCIIGVGGRIPGGYSANMIYLLAVWYNRVIMGLVIGFAGDMKILNRDQEKNIPNAIVRGLLFGLIISSATLLLSDTIFDLMGWAAGIVYGPIIDTIATVTEK